MPKELIAPDKVIAHYKCIMCEDEIEVPIIFFKKVAGKSLTFNCEKCGGFMNIIGAHIDDH